MMSNERGRQASRPVKVTKDNLIRDRNKKLPFAKQKEQNKGRTGRVDHAARTQCLEFSPNERMEKWNKKSWLMIDENNGCITKSKDVESTNWRVSVGLICRSVSSCLFFSLTLTSKKFISFFDHSAVNLIVGWKALVVSINCFKEFSPRSQMKNIPSIYLHHMCGCSSCLLKSFPQGQT